MTKFKNYALLLDDFLKENPGEHWLVKVGELLLGDEFDTRYKSLVRATKTHAANGKIILTGKGRDRKIKAIEVPLEETKATEEARLEYELVHAQLMQEILRMLADFRSALNVFMNATNQHINLPMPINRKEYDRVIKARVPALEILKKMPAYSAARKLYSQTDPDLLPPSLHETIRRQDRAILMAHEANIKQAEEDIEKFNKVTAEQLKELDIKAEQLEAARLDKIAGLEKSRRKLEELQSVSG